MKTTGNKIWTLIREALGFALLSFAFSILPDNEIKLKIAKTITKHYE